MKKFEVEQFRKKIFLIDRHAVRRSSAWAYERFNQPTIVQMPNCTIAMTSACVRIHIETLHALANGT